MKHCWALAEQLGFGRPRGACLVEGFINLVPQYPYCNKGNHFGWSISNGTLNQKKRKKVPLGYQVNDGSWKLAGLPRRLRKVAACGSKGPRL